MISLLFLAAALIYPLYLFFAPVKAIEDKKTDLRLPAVELLEAFEADMAVADEKYRGMILEVSGKVHQVDEAGVVPVVIFDKGGDYVVVANMLERYHGVLDNISGKDITIKGRYSGVIPGDAMMMIPGDVKIEQCTIVE